MIQDNSLKIIACGGFDKPGDIMELSFPLDQKFPNSEVITTKEILVIDDVAREYPHFEEETDKYRSGKIHSWLGLPLISKGTVTGMIAFDRHKVIPFTEFEIQMSSAIASQAALAIENASLYQDAKRRLEQIGSLRKIDQAIASTVDLRVTMNILVGHVIQQLDVDAAAVLLYRPHIDTLESVANQGFRTKVLQSANLRLGEGFAGQAALKRQIIKISDFNSLQTGYLRSPDFIKEEFVAYIGVPLLAKGKIIGVLEIFHRQPLNRDPEWMAFLETLAGQAAIAIDSINLLDSLQSTNVDLTLAYDATIEGWAQALELKDMETEGHSRRVVELTMELARRMGVSGEKLTHVRRGALLHDIGKMGIPDSILQKQGKLTDEEWQIMRKHPVYAFEWLGSIKYLQSALDIPYAHHERWDGSGYPQGLTGGQIPLAARIFAIVDVWDALGSNRPYRKAWPQQKIIKHIRDQSARHFDPDVVEEFLSIVIKI
jgi:putative nucleotidyltransferase with HDIG domain